MLSDKEVKERTDATIKMANVAHESATEVSSYMTAIWNNFNKAGTESAEHFGDVLTKLGATTAASTAELAGGLEKFASVADTIGLSYDYATAALATIIDKTRQSEDVVGTALKTIFARIQGLNLGENQDDGTTLNKYSDALRKVGVDIKDSNGELKDMDQILDELGSKWGDLSKDVQIATAQTVAGIRQYNQLIALMDNWDSFKGNLNTAKNADGELQKQAGIYEQSWEAARNKVKAAAQDIYSSLIDEEFFINFDKFLATALKGVSDLINGLGGVKGVLSAIGVLVTKTFGEQMANGLRNIAYNIKMSTTAGRNAAAKEKTQTMQDLRDDLEVDNEGIESPAQTARAEAYQEELRLQEELLENAENMSEAEIAHAQALIDKYRELGELKAKALQTVDDQKYRSHDATLQAQEDVIEKTYREGETASEETLGNVETKMGQLGQLEQMRSVISDVQQGLQLSDKQANGFIQSLEGMRETLSNIDVESLETIIRALTEGEVDSEKLKEALQKVGQASAQVKGELREMGVGNEAIKEKVNATHDLAKAEKQASTAADGMEKVVGTTHKRIQGANGASKDWANGLVSLASGLMSFSMLLNSINGMINTLKDPDASGWEKFTTVLMSFGMIVTGLVSTVNAFVAVKTTLNGLSLKSAINTVAEAISEAALAKAKSVEAKATVDQTKKKKANAAAIDNETRAISQNTKANLENAAAKSGETPALPAGGTAGTEIPGATKNNLTLKESFGKLFTAVKSFASAHKAMLMGVAAAAIVFTAAIAIHKQLESAYNADAKATEEAKATAEEMAQNYENVKSAYEEFKTSLSNYQDAKKGLSQLKEGTVEFQEAIIKANEEAMNLIHSVKGIQYSVNENGLIEIDEKNLEKAQKQQLDRLQKAYSAKQATAMHASDAQLKSDTTDFNRKYAKSSGGSEDTAIAVGQGLADVAAGVALGSILGPVGALIGGLGGAVVGLIDGISKANAQTNYEVEAMSVIADKYSQIGEAIFDKDTMAKTLEQAGLEADEAYINSLLDNEAATRDLIQATVENTAARKIADKQAAQNAVEGSEKASSSEYKSQITAVIGEKNMEKLRKQALKNLENSGWGTSGISKATKVNKEAERIFKEYMESAGMDADNFRLTDTTGTDKNRKFVYKSADGTQEFVVDLDTMRAAKAEADATEEGSKLADDYADVYNGKSESAANLLTAILTQNEGNLTLGQLQSGNANGLYNTLGLTNTDLNKLGMTRNQVIDQLNDVISMGQESYKEIINNYGSYLTNLQDISGAALSNLQSGLNELDSQKDKQQFMSLVNSLMEGVPDEARAGFYEGLSKVDFTAPDVYSQIMEVFSEVGVEADSGAVRDISNQFIDLYDSLAKVDLSQFNAQVADLLGILSKASFGSKITESEYEQITDDHRELVPYFEAQTDAEGNVTGYTSLLTSEQLTQIIGEIKETSSNESIGAYQQQKEARDKAKSQYEEAQAATKAASDKFDFGPEGVRANPDQFFAAYRDQYQQKFLEDTFGKFDLPSFLNNYGGLTQQQLRDWLKQMFLALGETDYISSETTNEQILEGLQSGKIQNDLYTLLMSAEGGPSKYFDSYVINSATSLGDASIGELFKGFFNPKLLGPDGYGGWTYDIDPEKALYDPSETLPVKNAKEKEIEAKATYDEEESKYKETEKAYLTESLPTVGLNEIAAKSELYDEASISDTEIEIANMSALNKEAQAYDLVADEVATYAKSLQEANPETIESTNEANRIAIANSRASKALKELSSNIEDYSKNLKGDKNSKQYAQSLEEFRKSMTEILNLDPNDLSTLSEEFLTNAKTLELAKKAANGDVDALNQLQIAAAQDYIARIEVDDEQAQADLLAFSTEIGNLDLDDIEIGTNLDDAPFYEALKSMLDAGTITVEQANNILKQIGYDPVIKEKEIKVESATQNEDTGEWTYVGEGPDGETITYKATQKMHTGLGTGQTIKIPYIDSGDTTFTGGGAAKAPAPKKSSGGGGGGGGGGSKPKKAKTPKYNDYIKRYKRIDDLLAKNKDLQEDISKVEDRLYGASKLNAMDQRNSLLREELKLTEQKRKEAEAYLKVDKQALNQAAANAGVVVEYDEDGMIANYRSVMEKLYNQMNSAVKSANADGNVTDSEQEKLDELQDKYDALKDAMDQYDETRELMVELDNDMADKINELQDLNFEKLNYKLEIQTTLSENEMKLIEYYADKLSDDIYDAAEALGYMSSKADIYLDKLQDQKSYWEEAAAAYAQQNEEDQISMAAFAEASQSSLEAILEQLSALKELDKTMVEYYGETLSKAEEELEKYTSQVEHCANVLDKYKEIVELINGEYDYETIGEILEGSASVAEDRMNNSRAWYESLADQKAQIEAKYNQAIASGNDVAAELFKKQLEDITESANAAEEQMLEDTRSWAEATKAVLTNTFQKAGRELEKALTDNMGFEALNNSLSRLNENQDLFLTKTNQIYKLNKLARKAQQDADKTQNAAAKARIANYIQETNELQNKNRLSKLELQIQEAKYKQLQAQIALEDAQNAKDTVRLQRDAEGNFGYVYTANQEKISNAEQALEDANNELYNIGLEAANNYGQKTLELRQQYAEAIQQLEENHLNGMYATEAEYQQARMQLENDFDQQMMDLREQYNIGKGVDARIEGDAWINAYENMITDGEGWKTAITGYVGEVDKAYDDWVAKVTNNETINGALTQTKDRVKDIATESSNVSKSIKDKVIPALKEELDKVQESTTKWAKHRLELLQTIASYETLARRIEKVIEDLNKQVKAVDEANKHKSNPDSSKGTQSNYVSDSSKSGDGSSGDKSGSGNYPNNQTSIKQPKSMHPVKKKVYEASSNSNSTYKTVNGIQYVKVGQKIGKDLWVRTMDLDPDDIIAASSQGGRFKNPNGYQAYQYYDTGGYTGKWGSDGKLAVLHEKEIVLNKSDTANLLKSVDVIRQITSQIDLDKLRVSSLQAASIVSGNHNSNFEQSVVIHADFPNASNSVEIETALNNLMLAASQRANRK